MILLCAPGRRHFICKAIVSVRVRKPRGIAVDPNAGRIFFTVWGQDPAKIESAELDGAGRTVVVDSKIVYPYGVTADYPNGHIYWVDTYLDYIERADYDGRNRKTVLRGSPVQNLYSVSVFQNDLFVTSWRDNSILRVDKFRPGNHSTVLRNLERPFAISVFHRQRQPLQVESSGADGIHPCQRNKPCQHVRHLITYRCTSKHLIILSVLRTYD